MPEPIVSEDDLLVHTCTYVQIEVHMNTCMYTAHKDSKGQRKPVRDRKGEEGTKRLKQVQKDGYRKKEILREQYRRYSKTKKDTE